MDFLSPSEGKGMDFLSPSDGKGMDFLSPSEGKSMYFILPSKYGVSVSCAVQTMNRSIITCKFDWCNF